MYRSYVDERKQTVRWQSVNGYTGTLLAVTSTCLFVCQKLREWVSEQFLSGTSVQYRLYSYIAGSAPSGSPSASAVERIMISELRLHDIGAEMWAEIMQQTFSARRQWVIHSTLKYSESTAKLPPLTVVSSQVNYKWICSRQFRLWLARLMTTTSTYIWYSEGRRNVTWQRQQWMRLLVTLLAGIEEVKQTQKIHSGLTAARRHETTTIWISTCS